MRKLHTWYREFLMPTGLVGSLTIGAGMFAIPYAFAQSGFLTGALYLTFFSLVFIKINTSYANIIAQKPSSYRFVSFAKMHLGKPGFWAAIFAVVIGFLVVLTIYIILSSSFWNLVATSEGQSFNIFFWLLGSLSIIISLKKLSGLDFLTFVIMGLIILLLLFLGLRDPAPISLTPLQPMGLLIPYGIVLFALSSRAAIAPLEDYFEREKIDWKKARRPIIWGTALPAILFFLFTIAVNALSPAGISEDAVSGLVIPNLILSIVGILGILAIWTSYLMLGTEIKDILTNDLHLPQWVSLSLVTFVPIALYLGGISNFIVLVGIGGALFLATECILVALMDGKIRGKLNLTDKLLIAILAFGGLYEVLHVLLATI